MKGYRMDIKKLFRTFRRKLLLESAIQAALGGLLVGAAAVFVTSLVYHIRVMATPIRAMILAGGCGFFASFVLLMCLLFPTRKKTAARIDALGLQERIGTMLQFRNADTRIAQLQREDAQKHIKTVTTKQMHLKIRKREWISCLVSLCLAVVMVVLPADVFAAKTTVDGVELQREVWVRDLITELREQSEESELDSVTDDQVQQIIDELEKALEEAETDLERAALIEEARQKIKELLYEKQSKDKIGEALQQYEMTYLLGVGISEAKKETISQALDEIETMLKEDSSQIVPLSETITTALYESAVDADDELFCAVAGLSVDAMLLKPDTDTYEAKVEEACDRALEAIMAALDKQEKTTGELSELDKTLNDKKNELLGLLDEFEESKPEGERPEENPEGTMPSEPEGEQQPPEGERPTGGDPGQVKPGGEQASTMTEPFYDPISGKVTYGEVYATYYAEYLEALRAGEISEELQQKLDRYFAELE